MQAAERYYEAYVKARYSLEWTISREDLALVDNARAAGDILASLAFGHPDENQHVRGHDVRLRAIDE